MANRDFNGVSEQAKAGLMRLLDAEALLRTESPQGRERGAMYLAGYAIECKIKSRSMERNQCSTLKQLQQKLNLDFDEVYSHKLEALAHDLLEKSDLTRLKSNRDMLVAWHKVVAWKAEWRYLADKPSRQEARAFLDAVKNIRNWLENNT